MSVIPPAIRTGASASARHRRRPQAIDAPPASLLPSRRARVITQLLLIVTALYFIMPIVWVVIASTKSNPDLVTTPGFWFGEPNLVNNYVKLMGWTQDLFWRWVGNSLLYSLTAAVIGTLISVAAGYALAKFRFAGRGLAMGVILAGLLMPVALLTVPLYTVFQGLGLSNTMLAIIIPSCVSPFGVFLGRVYAESTIPTELLEAARIDGAREASIFFSIVLRLLAPAMVTIFLFIFVATWNNFLLPLMMISSQDLKPVTLGLYGMMSYFAPQKGAVMLGALLSVLPLIVLFLGLQKYWQSGLSAGAVKG